MQRVVFASIWFQFRQGLLTLNAGHLQRSSPRLVRLETDGLALSGTRCCLSTPRILVTAIANSVSQVHGR